MNNAGLPGTALGGLLYVGLALAMPFVELTQTLRGRSSVDRWKFVLRQVAMALGIVSAVLATVWLLTELSFTPVHFRPGRDPMLVGLIVVAPALVLLTLVCVLRIWAWALSRAARTAGAAAVGELERLDTQR